MKKFLATTLLAGMMATSSFAENYESYSEGDWRKLGSDDRIIEIFSQKVSLNPEYTHIILKIQTHVPAEDGFPAGNVYYLRLFQEAYDNRPSMAADIYMNDFMGGIRIAGMDIQPNASPYIEEQKQ